MEVKRKLGYTKTLVTSSHGHALMKYFLAEEQLLKGVLSSQNSDYSQFC